MPERPSTTARDRVAGRLARAMLIKPHRLSLATPIVTFSFDDFPASAWRLGGPILARHGARGTFYLSGELLNRADPTGAFATEADVHGLLEAGHELGCHTFSHPDLLRQPAAAIEAELDRNGRLIAALFGGYRPSSFAYPYGRASLRAKQLISERFVTLRGVRTGLNQGPVDLAMLRANELCAKTTPVERARALLEANAKAGGWLIFFTHDIADEPSEHGCRPADLAAVVEAAAGSGARLLTMAEAAEALGLAAEASARPMLDPEDRALLQRAAGLAATGMAALSIAASLAVFD